MTTATSTTTLIYLLANQMCLTYPTNQIRLFKNQDKVAVLVEEVKPEPR